MPWSRWHWRVVFALGVAWVLDGLEVTIVGSIGSMLERPDTLGLSAAQIGWAGSMYVAGAVVGALVFGRLADRLGRKRLFMITLAVYMGASVACGFSTGFDSFVFFRFLTGIGIGGEYAAINSAIDELIPARVRGRVSLAINGSFWIGAALGALLSLVLLDERVLGPEHGWRAGFLLGAVLALAILLVRRHVPESPRWLLAHGRADEAARVLDEIEASVRAEHPQAFANDTAHAQVTFTRSVLPSLGEVVHVLRRRYARRSAVVLALMVSQAFFYNAIFFTYALVLTRFYGVADTRVGLYLLPFAVGNVLGPLILGPLFDRIGRRVMIGATYALSGVGLLLIGVGFRPGRARRDDADPGLVGGLLPGIGGRELGLPHGQRSLPARDAGDLDLDLLRRRHRRGRLRGAGAVRCADRDRRPRQRVPGLRGGRGAGARGRRHRLALRRRRRAQVPGRNRPAAGNGRPRRGLIPG